MGFKKNNPGCNCCVGYVDVIVNGARLRWTTTGQTTLHTGIGDGKGYAPSFPGMSIGTSGNSFRGVDVTDGSDEGEIANSTGEGPGGVDTTSRVFPECDAVVCVGIGDPNPEHYTIETDGTLTQRTALGGGVDAGGHPAVWANGRLWRILGGGTLVMGSADNVTPRTDLDGGMTDSTDIVDMLGDGDASWLYVLAVDDIGTPTIFELFRIAPNGETATGEVLFLSQSGKARRLSLLGNLLYMFSEDQVWKYNVATFVGPELILERASGTWTLPSTGKGFLIDEG